MSEWLRELWSGKTDITRSKLLPDETVQHEMSVDKSYFAVDLQGMSLAEDYKFLTEFSPFLAFVLEFGTSEAEKISVLFNPKEKLEAMGSGGSVIRPDVRGITIIPERPLQTDKVTMFGGMFRDIRNDAGMVLLDTLSQLTQAGLQLPGAGKIKVAEIAYTGIRSLFGMNSSTGRATILRGFSTSKLEGDSDRLIPGWLLIMGDSELSPDDIEIVDGMPQAKSEKDRRKFENSDWILLRIRSEARRGRYNDLGFDPLWKSYQDALWANNTALADQEYKALNSAIVMCDLLIEEEKDVLLQDYNVRKLKEISRYQMANGSADNGAGADHRGGRQDGNSKNVRLLLNEAAVTIEGLRSLGSADELKSVSVALENLSKGLDDDLDLVPGPSRFEDITPGHLDALRANIGPANRPEFTSAVLSALGQPVF